MSKSQHKRICIQSQCAVRDELREQIEQKDKENVALEKAVDSYRDSFIEREARNENLERVVDDLIGTFEDDYVLDLAIVDSPNEGYKQLYLRALKTLTQLNEVSDE